MTTSFQTTSGCNAYAIGDTQYLLPEGRKLLRLSDFNVYAITDVNQDRREQPLGIIDSIQVSTIHHGPEAQAAAVVDLITRNGGKPTPNGAVA